MSISAIQEQALDAYGPILIKRGYEWVDLNEVSEMIDVEPEEMKHAFPSKALLCESWMELTDERAKKHHRNLLSSGKPMRETLDIYFGELESFMVKFGFKGCPFTNTSRALRDNPEPKIQERIVEHKQEIRSFFCQLCRRSNFHSEIVGEALFLIYSGATTECSNMQDLKPVIAGRQAALSLFDLYST